MRASFYSALGSCTSCLALLMLLAGLNLHAQKIALTWDDLPAHHELPPGVTRLDVIQQILAAMKEAGLPPAYGFVNGIRLQQEPGSDVVLKAWRAAGNPVGNHGWSHMNLSRHTTEEFERDVEKNEILLQSLMGTEDWHWLRYPNLAEGATAEQRHEVRLWLNTKGYHVAAVTMGFGDHVWNPVYARCAAQGNTQAIAVLEQTYLEAARHDAEARRRSARSSLGREIPYVLLMHVGAFDARMLPRLLALYKQLGFQFIALEQAEEDPFYAPDLQLSLPSVDPLTLRTETTSSEAQPTTINRAEIEALCR